MNDLMQFNRFVDFEDCTHSMMECKVRSPHVDFGALRKTDCIRFSVKVLKCN